MKILERRVTALETRPRPPDAATLALRREAVQFLCDWATPAETDYLLAVAVRLERGAALPDDQATVERLRCRWNGRFEDDTVTPEHVAKADRIDWNEPGRYLGGAWLNWLHAFPGRDKQGETTAADREQWWKLDDLTEHYIIRRAPLTAGLDRLEHGDLEELWPAIPTELRSL